MVGTKAIKVKVRTGSKHVYVQLDKTKFLADYEKKRDARHEQVYEKLAQIARWERAMLRVINL